MSNTLVYWIGILGIPGKGPHYMEPYDPNRTIGQIIQTMTATGHVERNKRVEMLKHQSGNVNKYDISDPYWSHDTKLSDYVNLMNGHNWKDIDLVCVFI
jgi:hypothetical protein